MNGGGPGAAGHLGDYALLELERVVERALEPGSHERLPALGYGEISLVLAWPPEAPAFACKRLPVFPTSARFDAYDRTLDDYLRALAAVGIRVVETELRPVELADGAVAGYVVQPILPAEQVAPAVLARADPATGHPLVEAVAVTAAAAVGPRLGLDAQLSNWVWDAGGLTYIDVSTPLIWSQDGRPRLDLDLLAQAFPWALRAPLRRFVAPGILDTYRDLRKVYLDVCGNLLKEGLDPWLPGLLAAVNRHLDDPLTAGEVRRYYRSDRRLWTALLSLRRLDSAWQRRVRRRAYPFLLPKAISR